MPASIEIFREIFFSILVLWPIVPQARYRATRAFFWAESLLSFED
jgi:hypothetical protein